MHIRKYMSKDQTLLFDLLIEEGDEWIDYHGPQGRDKYLNALDSCFVLIAEDKTELCGYLRCRDDFGFGVYIYDLLVRKSYRGKEIGKLLIESLYQNFPEQDIYVMSDIDPYYEKLGYQKIGSVFKINN